MAWPTALFAGAEPGLLLGAGTGARPQQLIGDAACGCGPFYRTRISIDDVALHGVPAGFAIIPGMPVTADVKVGRRTVLKYILGIVLPIGQEAMREP